MTNDFNKIFSAMPESFFIDADNPNLKGDLFEFRMTKTAVFYECTNHTQLLSSKAEMFDEVRFVEIQNSDALSALCTLYLALKKFDLLQ